MTGEPWRPDGWPRVAVRLFASDVGNLVAFLRTVFDAEATVRDGAPAEMRIGDSAILVSDGGGLRAPMPAFLHVYVEDADAGFARAIAAGARAVEAPADMPYGDRRATIEDRWGNIWQIATHRGRPA